MMRKEERKKFANHGNKNGEGNSLEGGRKKVRLVFDVEKLQNAGELAVAKRQ